MPRKKYLINLNDEERQTLEALTRKGQAKARQFKRTMILLKADEGLSDPAIMAALNVSHPCVERIRKRFVADGIERALNEDSRPGQKRRLDGRAEATLIATACTEATGRACTLELAPVGRQVGAARVYGHRFV